MRKIRQLRRARDMGATCPFPSLRSVRRETPASREVYTCVMLPLWATVPGIVIDPIGSRIREIVQAWR